MAADPYITSLVAAAPELTSAQIRQLRQLLTPAGPARLVHQLPRQQRAERVLART